MENTFTNGNFIDDAEKMRDFKTLAKDEFLNSYSYLTEAEYDNTAEIYEQIFNIAQDISEFLSYCGFDDVTDSSGYYVIKEFEDGTDRAVDVYKSTNDEKPYYVIYCSFENEESDFRYTDSLSVEELTNKLIEVYCE